jgi:hypothetical protein
MVLLLAGSTDSLAKEDTNMFCISTEGSERATTGPGNLIVTHEGRTHVVWQDSTTNGYFNRVRTFDHASQKWSPTYSFDKAKDNHARPVLAVDSKGFLHVILGGHNSPITHQQSARPNDASQWSKPVAIGSGTYVVMACGPDDTLYVTFRAKNHDSLELCVKPPGQPWQPAVKLVGRHPKYPGYSGFNNGMAFSRDGRVLHMVCDFYESKDFDKRVGLHQAVAYMRSPDGGKTWQRADGAPIEIPARPERMDLFAEHTRPPNDTRRPPLIGSGGGIVVDSAGKPYVFYSSHLKEPGELILATPDAAGKWQQRSLDTIKANHPGLVAMQRNFSITANDVIVGVIALAKQEEAKLENGLPTRASRLDDAPGNLAVWLISRDRGQTFTTRPVMPPNPQATRREFNLERPTGPGRGSWPTLMFFEGAVRYPEKGETIQNKVFWLETSDAR